MFEEENEEEEENTNFDEKTEQQQEEQSEQITSTSIEHQQTSTTIIHNNEQQQITNDEEEQQQIINDEEQEQVIKDNEEQVTDNNELQQGSDNGSYVSMASIPERPNAPVNIGSPQTFFSFPFDPKNNDNQQLSNSSNPLLSGVADPIIERHLPPSMGEYVQDFHNSTAIASPPPDSSPSLQEPLPRIAALFLTNTTTGRSSYTSATEQFCPLEPRFTLYRNMSPITYHERRVAQIDSEYGGFLNNNRGR